MANRFELLLPDIVGSFDRGRAQARQVDRERLADQELRAQLERGNRFRELAGQAYGARTPGEREQFVSQAAAADPQGAMALDRQMGSNEERKQQRLGVWARVLTQAPEQMKPLLYRQMQPEMRSFGLDVPPEYTPEVGQMAQAFMAQQSGQAPAQLQYFDAMTAQMTPEDREQSRRVQMGLAPRPSSAAIGYKVVRGADGRERLVAVDPRTPGAMVMEGEGGAFTSQTPGEKVTQEAEAKADVELRTGPQIAGATTSAEEQAKAAAKQQENQRKNQTAFNVYTAARDNLERAMAGTDTGPIAGRIPAVTSAQQIAEGSGAAMAPVLKQLFREAGEGTFTEGDQKLLTDMLPTRTDHPEARAAKLQMIDQIIAAKLGTTLPQRGQAAPPSGAQRQPAAAAPSAEVTATGPNGQKVVLRGGQWVPLQ